MQRKVIQQSASSMGISLPSKWSKRWNLKKGDLVDIDDTKGILEIKPVNYNPEEKKAVIDAHLYGKLTRRKFDNLSKNGYDEIKVTFQNEKELQPIKETLQVEATMFEITKKEKEFIIVKAISEINTDELNNIINRLIFLLLESISKTEEHLRNPDEQSKNDILDLEKANNRLSHMCMRGIHKQPLEEESYVRYTFIWAIEKLGNDFKFLSHEKITNKETVQILLEVLENLRLFGGLYFKYDSKKATMFYEKRKKLAYKIIESMRKKNADAIGLHLASSMNEKSLYLLGLIFGLKEDHSGM